MTLLWSNSGVLPVKPESCLEADLLLSLGHLQDVPEVDAGGYQQGTFSRWGYLFHAVVGGESDFDCFTKATRVKDKEDILEDKREHDAGVDETVDTMNICYPRVSISCQVYTHNFHLHCSALYDELAMCNVAQLQNLKST